MSSARLFDGLMLANKIKSSIKQVQYVLLSIVVPVSMVVSIRIRLPYSYAFDPLARMAHSGNVGIPKILFDFSFILSHLIQLVCLSSNQEKK